MDLDNEEIEATKSLHNNSDNMSEEEIIKEVENLIIVFADATTDRGYTYEEQISAEEQLKTIQGLLDLYNKEKEKNEELENQRKNGTLSDGFHTFNDLYYQRCVLFATICNLNKNIAWKSKKHSDGKKCFDSDNWFIVGIDTPEGTYTYHYEMKYWDLFKVKELENGKEWDGHTEKDVTRLFSLKADYISKDKIRERIKEMEDLNSEFSQRVIKSKEVYLTELVQNILRELLEE